MAFINIQSLFFRIIDIKIIKNYYCLSKNVMAAGIFSIIFARHKIEICDFYHPRADTQAGRGA
jgi:hypothetical protein